MTLDDRTILLIGKENFNKISNLNILVVGLGGVGSIVPTSLVRSGVKNITIVDKDKVEITNLNRQLAYINEDVGKFKSIALKKHLLEIKDDIAIKEYHQNICDLVLNFKQYDYIIDCIDDIKSKVNLIKKANELGAKIISSLGMGNRIDPTKVIITKLNKTTTDPFAKKLRYELKKENVDMSKVIVSFSLEKPIIKDKIISSMVFVPNASGLALASYIINETIKG